jgi:hypothetical protein
VKQKDIAVEKKKDQFLKKSVAEVQEFFCFREVVWVGGFLSFLVCGALEFHALGHEDS